MWVNCGGGVTSLQLEAAEILPEDGVAGALVGRVWRADIGGPAVVRIDNGGVFDITRLFPTMSALCEEEDPALSARRAKGEALGRLSDILLSSAPGLCQAPVSLLAPIDLQAIKAAGVTFILSLLERVIEEQARGDPQRADAVRAEIQAAIGHDLSGLRPGSPQAASLKSVLIARGLWSQYLEVGIGPDAEIFTKAQPMSAVGTGADIGILPSSTWNNPEPEVVLVINSRGKTIGASLGNDVNLRDIEGRSALLLGRSKDNNASAAIGPFIRLFDKTFSIEDIRQARVELIVEGADGYRLTGASNMSAISRDPLDLVAQTIGPHHQYPDGVVLFCGTMFAPIVDRDVMGEGFTHKRGDVVTIRSAKLGSLINRVQATDKAPPWVFGVGALMRHLGQRGLI